MEENFFYVAIYAAILGFWISREHKHNRLQIEHDEGRWFSRFCTAVPSEASELIIYLKNNLPTAAVGAVLLKP